MAKPRAAVTMISGFLFVMTLKAVLFIPCVSASCAAEYQESLNHTMRLKETCAEAAFRDCCQVCCHCVYMTHSAKMEGTRNKNVNW